jgi:hypothetical protein
MQTATNAERVAHDVLRWRREQLVRAGVPLPLATRIAGDPRYDLHALIGLVERGCPPEVAVRILAPLDLDGPA